MVGIQEAVHEIMHFDLTICSDTIQTLNLSMCQTLLRKGEKKKGEDLVNRYMNRSNEHESLSLERYFYEVWCNEKTQKGKEKRILRAVGLHCKPVYPVDFNYARGMIWLHKPWRQKDCEEDGAMRKLLQDKDKEKTKNLFLQMLDEPGKLPMAVINQFRMAQKYSREAKIELLAKQGLQICQKVNESLLDDDELEQHIHCENCAQKTMGEYEGVEIETHYNIGRDYDWTTHTFQEIRDVTADGRNYLYDLQTMYYEDAPKDDDEKLELPRRNGRDYSFESLTDEQKVIVLGAVDAVVKFLTNDENYKPFRATVMGFGGTGKSFIINTIITLVRKLTNCNNSVKVAAPSGAAAFNVRGCTLHRLLGIDTNSPSKKMSKERLKSLQKSLMDMLVLMIDERSMINSDVMAATENNLRLAVFGGQNSKEYFGGLPVVILFGDDYQLPPIGGGAIKGFVNYKKGNKKGTTGNGFIRSGEKVVFKNRGDILFRDQLTENVFELTKNLRVTEESKHFQGILQRLRLSEQTLEDSTVLNNLNLWQEGVYPKGFQQKLEDDPKTLFVYANNEPRKVKNMTKLKETSEKHKVPVARLNCHYESIKPGDPMRLAQRHHFKNENYQDLVEICLHSRVSLTDNFIPEIGLFNGARGTVVQMIFNHAEGPNDNQHKHLPEFIVVDFPQLALPEGYEPWDKNHPTVSAIKCTLADLLAPTQLH